MRKLARNRETCPSGDMVVKTGIIGLIVLSTIGLGQLTIAADQPTPAELERMREALPDKPPVTPTEPRKLLVYCRCEAFSHSSIPYAAAALKLMGEQTGAFTAEICTDPAVFSPKNLRQYDAICFNNTTGELFEDDFRKRTLLMYARDGGGIVGIHAATDCFYNWPEYGELIGGYFAGHPWHEEVTVRVEEPNHPIAAMFPDKTFKITDEIYQFRAPYSRNRLRILLSLDTTQTDMTKAGIRRNDNDFAVSWIHNYGRGRVFYCSLGHDHDIFWNPTVLAHYLAGIQFALGDLRANAVASNQVSDDGWIHLFNGIDLTGWIHNPGSWTVEDGILTLQGGGDMWSEQRFGNFVLDLEYRQAEQTNSGIFFRCGSLADWINTCIELQVENSYGKDEPDKHDAGAIYDIKEPRINAVRPPGKWNHVTLTVRGSHIHAVLNGHEVIDIDLDDWTTPHRNPDGTTNKFKYAYCDMPRWGHLGLQDHGDPVWYRNVRIKPLD